MTPTEPGFYWATWVPVLDLRAMVVRVKVDGGDAWVLAPGSEDEFTLADFVFLSGPLPPPAACTDRVVDFGVPES